MSDTPTNVERFPSSEGKHPAGVLVSMEPIAVGVQQAADLVGVSRRYLDSRIADGDLAVTKLGRRTVISVAALRDFIDRHATGAARK